MQRIDDQMLLLKEAHYQLVLRRLAVRVALVVGTSIGAQVLANTLGG